MATGLVPASSLDYAEEFAGLAERFAVTVADADLSAVVPGCPGWSVYDLLLHLGNIHAWAATIVETGLEAPAQHDEPPLRRPRVASEWYAGKAEDLYEVLRGCDPAAEAWNFSTVPRVAGFWRRRQTHEVLVHLVDLHQALDRPLHLPGPLATDAIGEALEVFLPRMHQRGHPADLQHGLVMETTDTDRAWTLSPRPPGPPAVDDGELMTGADRVEAPASVLLPVLWKRLPPETPGLRVVGDRGRVQAFLASRLTA